jgi:hypothetical protein
MMIGSPGPLSSFCMASTNGLHLFLRGNKVPVTWLHPMVRFGFVVLSRLGGPHVHQRVHDVQRRSHGRQLSPEVQPSTTNNRRSDAKCWKVLDNHSEQCRAGNNTPGKDLQRKNTGVEQGVEELQ